MTLIPTRLQDGWIKVTQQYTASDGQSCELSVNVKLAGSDQTDERAIAEAQQYFNQYGYRVIEDAKAKGYWPLPPDHPNAPGNG